jgi:hypothetical protein
MTSAHILYIPTVFMLGILTGMLIKSSGKVETNTPSQQRVSGLLLLGSLFVFLFAFIGTHFFPIPRSAHAVHHALDGAEIFDKKPSYTSSEVYERINDFPEGGRILYKQFSYTTDILFPITLFCFLILLSIYVSQRAMIPQKLRIILVFIPIMWFSFDMVENAIVYHILDIYPMRKEWLASILGYVTIVKFALLLLSVAIPALIKAFEKSLIAKFLAGQKSI